MKTIWFLASLQWPVSSIGIIDRSSESCTQTNAPCGFGYTCSANGRCVQDFSRPMDILRDSVDQGPAEVAQVYTAAHVLDDRLLALKRTAGDGRNLLDWDRHNWKRSPREIISLGQLRDCIFLMHGKQFFDYDTARRVLRGGLTSEKEYPYSMENKHCERHKHAKLDEFKYPLYRKVLSASERSCFHSMKDLETELRYKGPVPVDIKIYKEILEYDELLKQNRAQVLSRRSLDIFENGELLGYTSGVISGMGYDGVIGGEYFLVKLHWGTLFGESGYIKVESELLFQRYILACGSPLGDFSSKDSASLYPRLSFLEPTRSGSDKILEKIIADRNLNRPSGVLRAAPIFVDERLDLNIKDLSGEIPGLRFTLRMLLRRLKSKFGPSTYALVSIKYADLSIVSGRRIFTIVALRENRDGRDPASFNYRNEEANIRNGFSTSETYFEFSLWIPLKSSTTTEFRDKQVTDAGALDWIASYKKEVGYVLAERFITQSYTIPSKGKRNRHYWTVTDLVWFLIGPIFTTNEGRLVLAVASFSYAVLLYVYDYSPAKVWKASVDFMMYIIFPPKEKEKKK